MTELAVDDLTVHAKSTCLVEHASLKLATGELIAILGPNGAGKSSLLRAIMGLLPASSGTVLLNGEDCSTVSANERALAISYLPQIRPLAWPLSVRDVISLGRFSHGTALGKLSPADSEAVQRAIKDCDLEALSGRSTQSLSGGEIARVHFARALSANTPLLIADEPIAALDPLHQLRIGALIKQFVNDGGGALVVLHEVSIAARIADRLIWMLDGKIVANGPPNETLTPENMARVYGVHAVIARTESAYDVRIEGIV